MKFFCKSYEHLLLMGDFNANISEPTLTSSCTLFKGQIDFTESPETSEISQKLPIT